MKSEFFRATASRVFAMASALVAGFVSLKLYSHYLNPEIYGVVLVALQITSYLPYLDGGFRTTVNQSVLSNADPNGKQGLLRFCQVFYTGLAIAALPVSLLCMWGYSMLPSAHNSGNPTSFFLVLGLVGTLAVIGMAQMSLLIGLQRQSSLYLLNGCSSWLTVSSLWLALENGAGVWAFPISSLAGLGGTYPMALWMIRQCEPDMKFFSLRLDAEFWRYFSRLKSGAWGCFQSQVSILLLFTIDVVLVGLICGPTDAAIYGVLSRLFGIVRNFIQVAGEAAWPIVAQGKRGTERFMLLLLRLNGWVYGGVMGALALTLKPFLHWYMGASWTPGTSLLLLLLARFMITGVSSPAGYFLIGLGHFKTLARYNERELLAAVLLAIPAGIRFGVTGIAWSFLLATACGNLTPIINAYARIIRFPIGRLLAQIWWRSVFSLGASLIAANLLRRLWESDTSLVFVGLGSVIVALGIGVFVAISRVLLVRPLSMRTLGLRDVINQI